MEDDEIIKDIGSNKIAIGRFLNNQDFGFSMLFFWSAYIIVTLIGMLHTIFNIYVLHMKSMDKDLIEEGYKKTKSWNP